MSVLIDGQPVAPEQAVISVFDHGLLRGDGCFETIRMYGGRPFALTEHLERLEASAAQLRLPLPPREQLAAWVVQAAGGGDEAVRLVITRGALNGSAPSRCLLVTEPLPESPPESYRLLAVVAPWHPGGVHYELEGAKTLSYANNMAATRRAQEEGFDDALLVSKDGIALEGPTFCIGWFRKTCLETPALELGVLHSITRAKVLEVAPSLGLTVQGRFPLERVLGADEVFAMSTIKEIAPISQIGDKHFKGGSQTEKLADAFRRLVQEQLS